MSDHIPFDIQSEIIKNLPVKSLLQFRSVSKQWKSFIDRSEFVRNYHINRTRHHLLVKRTLDNNVPTYTSIIDDNTFPQQKFPLTAPESLNSLRRYPDSHTSVNGLICVTGFGVVRSDNMMSVIWNPSIRKSVSIVIRDALIDNGYTVIAFGVSPDDTSDPILVRISVYEDIPCTWVVKIFTLSTRVWNTVYNGVPFKSCDLTWDHVFIDGIIYWKSVGWEGFRRSNYIISFDLKRETFSEVSLSERLARAVYNLILRKVNEALGLLEYYNEGDLSVCGVWMKKDGVNEPFTKIYTIRVEGKSVIKRVQDFRNNGEVVLEMDDDTATGNNVEVYELSSGHINGVGINGNARFFTVSYTETLLLLNEPNSIIHG